MLDTWNESIFSNIKSRLQDSAMKLVHAERQGEAFDSQLVIGVRESYGKTERNEHMNRNTERNKLLLMSAETQNGPSRNRLNSFQLNRPLFLQYYYK